MLFVIDAGNTNIVGGAYENGRLVETMRIRTVQGKTEDEYAVIVRVLLEDRGIDPEQIDRVIISSVVPQLTSSIEKMARHLFNVEPVTLGPALYAKLPVKVIAVDEIGSDLVADALAAWNRFGGACLVVDFGTALTFTAVDATGRIAGVSIAPGLGTAAGSLSRNTAQLPSVPLEAPSSAMGSNTIQAIQAGVILGYTGLVEYMVKRITAELGGAKVVATGGMCRVISGLTNVFDAIEPDLTLDGLASMERFLY
ncbi:MAG: type III pantothenate kinase [Spirochaetes bacterium RIFOXYC1_FULL_54_7]|nr:MAG: type III pantothenate kinase [Spirochaetes bacterium RIFOXYC1_FULL_54_7]